MCRKARVTCTTFRKVNFNRLKSDYGVTQYDVSCLTIQWMFNSIQAEERMREVENRKRELLKIGVNTGSRCPSVSSVEYCPILRSFFQPEHPTRPNPT
jgi:hypothetical protein